MPTVNYSLIDATGAGITDVVRFAIQSPPVEIGTTTVLGALVTSFPDVDGAGTVTLKPGNYRVTVANQPDSGFSITVPDDALTHDLVDLIT